MKKLIMSTTMLFFFLASWFGRYTPVQLDMSRPDTIQAEIKGEVIRPGVYQIPWTQRSRHWPKLPEALRIQRIWMP